MNSSTHVLSDDAETPVLNVHINELYDLYHYLVTAGSGRVHESNPIMQEAARQAVGARHLMGVHGIWDEMERPLASALTIGGALSDARGLVNDTLDRLESALGYASEVFHRDIWPQHQVYFSAALGSIQDQFAAQFDEMVRAQATILDVVWPERVDAYFVTDCYAPEGAYSHPLTIDVRANTGTTLCETVLHEATHVADVYSREVGRETLGRKLGFALMSAGTSPTDAWNAWHAVIFASSAYQIRTRIDRTHVDYADGHHLYDRLGVPKLPGLWEQYASGAIEEGGLIDGIAAQIVRR